MRPSRTAQKNLNDNFNPRTPCGVRPCPSGLSDTKIEISIHALLAECDLPCSVVASANCAFQSTHSLRSATCCVAVQVIPTHLFQSTHSLRSATLRQARRLCLQFNFNPRTPCGVRPYLEARIIPVTNHFNPRTPCGVRLDDLSFIFIQTAISIHALLAECDWSCCQLALPQQLFQSTHSLRSATRRKAGKRR